MKGSKLLTKIGRKLKVSAPTILTIFGVGGLAATSILAVKVTPKAVRIIDEKQLRSPEPLTKMEITKLCWNLYIPSTIVGLSTITCIVGANILNQRQQASIVSLYGMLDQSYKRYRKAACEVYGEDADSNIIAQVAKDVYVYDRGICGCTTYSPDLDEASEKVLFYDAFSGRYFQSAVASVINAQYHINRNWVLQGEVTMNEFYDFLGIDKIAGGDDVGWTYEYAEEGMAWIDFDISKTTMDDGLECYILTTPFGPDPIGWTMDDASDAYNGLK